MQIRESTASPDTFLQNLNDNCQSAKKTRIVTSKAGQKDTEKSSKKDTEKSSKKDTKILTIKVGGGEERSQI